MTNQVNGVIAFYGLTDWWLSVFTESERQYIVGKYTRGETKWERENYLTEGDISINQEVTTFLSGLSTWFRAKKDAEIREKILQEMRELALTHPVSKPGFYKGRHFSTYPDDIRKLKREGNFEEAERLLLHLVRATETESAVEGYREVAPWYYWELAKIYRKQKNYSAEVKVIERYSGLLTHTPGKRGAQILERLSKAKELKAKSARTNSPEE